MSIIVKHLTKTYEIDSIRIGGGAKDVIKRFFAKPKKTFYALHNLSFSVEPGSRLVLLGENGAGKSTLLKIISGVTRPTSGEVTVVGKVASLLEVGAGFHPELSGRENIFLNGTILGLTKKEIQKGLEEIVDFAEVEPFLEMPVKYYSSGMRSKLAFSIAIYGHPDLLILDEVLSVGDHPFQRRCEYKIDQLVKKGSTLIAVGHQLESLSHLCDRAIYLEKGVLMFDGPLEVAKKNYLERVSLKPILSLKGSRKGMIESSVS